MFLITTADECTWKKDEKILLLGKWCLLYSRKKVWSHLDFEVLPYHWDDRGQLYRDYHYITDVYERYLKDIAAVLNALHGCDHSLRYWRILIGPWLRYFIDILYDRFRTLIAAAHTGAITSTWIIKQGSYTWLPRDFNQFSKYFVSDQWNHFIYSEIIKRISGIPYHYINEYNFPPSRRVKTSMGYRELLRYIARLYSSMVPDKFNSVVFVSSGWGITDLCKLQLSLGQLPNPYSPRIELPDIAIDESMRGQLKIDAELNEFEEILKTIIPMQIPVAYIEGYEWFRDIALRTFPKRPRIIYTANAYSSNDAFKIWSAENVEKGTKLFIGQHGGNYGTSLWEQTEDHQIDIADKFYTWGWNNRLETNLKSLSAGKLLHSKKEMFPDPKGPIISVLATFPRYSYRMYSTPVAGQQLDYINDQIRFAKSVSEPVFKMLKLRLYQQDYDWDIKLRLKDAGLESLIDNSKKSFTERLKQARLCVSTYNATTYLESFAANYPSLLFWNPKHWELRPAAQPYFDELRRVGVLHVTPESAAAKLNEIYADPLSWWNQPEIQAVKDEFCEQFAYVSDNWLQEWKMELQSRLYGN